MTTVTIQTLDGSFISIPLPETSQPIVNPYWAAILEQGLDRLLILKDDEFVSEEGKSFNICCCLGDNPQSCYWLKLEIGKRLGKYAFFSSWLCMEKEITPGPYVVQLARRAWMLNMIREFKGETT